MTDVSDKNVDQAASWGRSGVKWAEWQEHLDQIFIPATEELLRVAAITPSLRVLDIGCGTGETSLLAAERTGPSGHVLGLDISASMLVRARERMPAGIPVEFVQADATVYQFPPADADLLLSRFGVMFFAEPVVAFANMRQGLKLGGRVAFACWRERKLNPYLTLPFEALLTAVPAPAEQPAPDAPGPFALADGQRLRDILAASGYSEIVLDPFDFQIDLAGGRGFERALQTALEIGPASRLLAEQSPELRRAGIDAIRTALAAHQQGDRVPLDAALWIVTATNQG